MPEAPYMPPPDDDADPSATSSGGGGGDEGSDVVRDTFDRSGVIAEVEAARKAVLEAAGANDEPERPPPKPAPAAATAPGAGKDAAKAPDAAKPPPTVDDAVRAELDRRAKDQEAQEVLRRDVEAKVRAEYDQRMARELEQERARARGEARDEELRRLRADPAGAIKAAGWDPKGLMVNLAEDGTPMASVQRENLSLRAALEDVNRKLSAIDEGQKARETAAKEAEAQRVAQQQQAAFEDAKTQFLGEATQAEKYPNLASYLARPRLRDALIEDAREFALKHNQTKGAWPSWAEIAQHLEEDYAPGQAQPNSAAGKTASTPPAQNGKGARIPSQSQASERRTFRERAPQTEREQRDALKAEVEAARREYLANEGKQP